MGVTASVAASYSTTTDKMQKSLNARTKETRYSIGSGFPTEGIDVWTNKAKDSPMPVSYELRGIQELVEDWELATP